MDIFTSSYLNAKISDADQFVANFSTPMNRTQAELIVGSLTFTVIIGMTIVGNILVVLSIFTYKPLHKVQNYFLVSLAAADLSVALLVMPLHIAKFLLGRWVFGLAICQIWLTLDILTCTASILNLCAIALDRYWAITNPIDYCNKRTMKFVLSLIAAVWGLSALISIPPSIGWNDWSAEHLAYTCELTQDKAFVVYSSCGSFYIPLIVMTIVYVKIFLAARKRLRSKRPTTIAGHKKEGRHRHSHKTSGEGKRLTILHPKKKKQRHNSKTTTAPLDDMLNRINNDKIPLKVCCASYNSPAMTKDGISAMGGANNGQSTEMNASTGSLDDYYDDDDQTIYTPSRQNTIHSKRGSRAVNIVSILDPDREATGLAVGLAAARKCSTAGNDGHLSPITADNGQAAPTVNISQQPAKPKMQPLTALPPMVRPLEAFNVHKVYKDRERISVSKEKKAAKTLAIIMGVFVLCWLPFFCIYLLKPFCKTKCHIHPKVEETITWLGYINSAINPVIYTIFNMDFRKAFSKYLCFLRSRRRRSATRRL